MVLELLEVVYFNLLLFYFMNCLRIETCRANTQTCEEVLNTASCLF